MSAQHAKIKKLLVAASLALAISVAQAQTESDVTYHGSGFDIEGTVTFRETTVACKTLANRIDELKAYRIALEADEVLRSGPNVDINRLGQLDCQFFSPKREWIIWRLATSEAWGSSRSGLCVTSSFILSPPTNKPRGCFWAIVEKTKRTIIWKEELR